MKFIKMILGGFVGMWLGSFVGITLSFFLGTEKIVTWVILVLGFIVGAIVVYRKDYLLISREDK